MSALVTATLLGNDRAQGRRRLMMGAANFADIFALAAIEPARCALMRSKTFGWSLDQYREFFRELFGPADPMRFPDSYDPDKILMIDAMFDDCMPESSRAALWEIAGHPERITMLYRHRRSFYSLTPLGLNFTRRKIYQFLDNALSKTDERPPALT